MVGTFLLFLLGALVLVKLDKLSIFSVDSSGVGLLVGSIFNKGFFLFLSMELLSIMES